MKKRKFIAIALVLAFLLAGCSSLFAGDTTVVLPKQQELLPSASFDYTDTATIGKFDKLEGFEAFLMPEDHSKDTLAFQVLGLWQENGETCIAYAYQTLIETPEYKAAAAAYKKAMVLYEEYTRQMEAYIRYTGLEAIYKRYLKYLESDEYKAFKKSPAYEEYLRTGVLPDNIMAPPIKPEPVPLPPLMVRPTTDKIPSQMMVTELAIRRGLSKTGTTQTLFRQLTVPFNEVTMYASAFNDTGGVVGRPELFFLYFHNTVYYITPTGTTTKRLDLYSSTQHMMEEAILVGEERYKSVEITNVVPCGNNKGFVVEMLLQSEKINEHTQLSPEDTELSVDVSFEIIENVGSFYTSNMAYKPSVGGSPLTPTWWSQWASNQTTLNCLTDPRSYNYTRVDENTDLANVVVAYDQNAWRFFRGSLVKGEEVKGENNQIAGQRYVGRPGSYSILLNRRPEACSYASLNCRYYVRYNGTSWTQYPTNLPMPGKNGIRAADLVNAGMSFNLAQSVSRRVQNKEKIMKVEAIDTYNYGVFTDKGVYISNCNDDGVPFTRSRYIPYALIDQNASTHKVNLEGTPSKQTQETMNRRKELSRQQAQGAPPQTEKEALDQYGLSQKDMKQYGISGSREELSDQILNEDIPAYELYGGKNFIVISNTRVLITTISNGVVVCDLQPSGLWTQKQVMDYPLFYSWSLGGNRYAALGFSNSDKKYTMADISKARILYYTLEDPK